MTKTILQVVVLLLVGSRVVADQTKTGNDCPTCQSSTGNFDEVSLLTLKTQLRLGKEPDVVATDKNQERGLGTCGTAKCNADVCGKLTFTASPLGVPSSDIIWKQASGSIEKISSPFCQTVNKYANDECCREDYDGGYPEGKTMFRKSVNTGLSEEEACALCVDITNIAGPVTLYYMRHAEGCHNTKSHWGHTHKGLTADVRDAPLTTNGLLQAAGAQDFVNTLPHLDRAVVSDMRRAQQTAELAFQGTPYENMEMKVVPWVNEETGSVMGITVDSRENLPTSPDFQRCLMGEDQALPHTLDIKRCVRYQTAYRTVDTCTGSRKKVYSDAAKETNPNYFADFITSHWGKGLAQQLGREPVIFLTGHSNWAKKAGMTGEEEGGKVSWAQIFRVDVVPGKKLADCAMQSVYPGTPKAAKISKGAAINGKSSQHVKAEPRCVRDLEDVATCKSKLGEDRYEG